MRREGDTYVQERSRGLVKAFRFHIAGYDLPAAGFLAGLWSPGTWLESIHLIHIPHPYTGIWH